MNEINKIQILSSDSLDSGETDSSQQDAIFLKNTLTIDLISAIAGDRELILSEINFLNSLYKLRGLNFYSDILYCITHQLFAPEIAKDLWDNIIKHKYNLSEILMRNVKIVVAALDYLSNITDNIVSTTLVGENHIYKIIELSLHDGLTGLFNHTYFYQQLDLEMRKYIRYGTLLSLILIDIDDFKNVNDKYGHREGDRILASLSHTLMNEARDSDICCRYGGEEFAVILPLTDTHSACSIAERIQNALIESLSCGKEVTTSIGVAAAGESTETCKKIVELADKALYKAKTNGKNQVVVII